MPRRKPAIPGKRGRRPAGPASRINQVAVRLSDQEKAAVDAEARRLGLQTSAWLRMLALAALGKR